MIQIKVVGLQVAARVAEKAAINASGRVLRVWHGQHQTDTCPKKDSSTLFLYDDQI
jgi:hypothetical protein